MAINMLCPMQVPLYHIVILIEDLDVFIITFGYEMGVFYHTDNIVKIF